MFKKIFFALLFLAHLNQASDTDYTFSLSNEHGKEVYKEKFVLIKSNQTLMHKEQCLDTDHWTDYVACPIMATCCIYSYTICPYATCAMTGCCLVAIASEQSYKEPKRIE